MQLTTKLYKQVDDCIYFNYNLRYLMTIQWNKLRSFNGSQHNAFEELVCQLANAESVDKKKSLFESLH